MPSFKKIAASIAAACLFSGVNAGPCKPTPSPTSVSVATPTAELCTLPQVVDSRKRDIFHQTCGSQGTVSTVSKRSLDILDTKHSVSLQECATFASTYEVSSEVRASRSLRQQTQTHAKSIAYDAASRTCRVFEQMVVFTDCFTENNSGASVAYDVSCFTCPNSEEVDDSPRCYIHQAARKRGPRSTSCGVDGHISVNNITPLASYRTLGANYCADKCDERQSCATFAIFDDGTCRLYSETPNALQFSQTTSTKSALVKRLRTSLEDVTLYEQSCFRCTSTQTVELQ